MKSITYIFITISVILVAFWAYQESYKAKVTLNMIKTIKKDISYTQERLSVLKVEWAYLNRPDRLRALADLNFKSLKLIELNTKHFGDLVNIRSYKKDLSINGSTFLNQINFDSHSSETSE